MSSGTRHPDAAAAGVRTEQIRLGRHQFGDLLLGTDVETRPDAGLTDAHVEEVFPRLGLEVLDFLGRQRLAELLHRGRRIHQDRAAAFLHFLQHRVVAQAGGNDERLVVGRVLGEHVRVLDDVVLAEGVGRLGLEQQEPRAHRAVAVLEAGRHEAVFHHRQLGADFSRHRVGRAGVPDGIPDAAHALAGGARTEHVHRAAGHVEDRLGLEDVELVLAHREAHRAGDLIGIVGVEQILHDEDALEDVLHAERLLGGFGDDGLVAFAVDHDLPAARAHRLAAVFERLAALLLPARAVDAAAFHFLPDRQAPFLEQVHRIVDVTADVVDEVVAGDAHQVGGDVAAIILGGVGPEIGVDRRKAHRDGAGAVHRRLVDERDLDLVAGPALRLEGGAAGGHAAADDQDIGFVFDDFRIAKTGFSHCESLRHASPGKLGPARASLRSTRVQAPLSRALTKSSRALCPPR